MKVELQNGDRITIPEGCKAVINGNEVVVEKEGHEFKDGDIIAKSKAVAILKGGFNNGMFRDYASLNFDGNVLISNDTEWITNPAGWHIAKEEERQLLFDKMAEHGLRWNAEEKRVEKIRWRAKDGKEYYYVGNQGTLMVDKEDGHCADENRHEFSNYFRTSEQAEEAAKRMKEVLRKYHEEIGE